MRDDALVFVTADPVGASAGFTVRRDDSAPVDDSWLVQSFAFDDDTESLIEYRANGDHVEACFE